MAKKTEVSATQLPEHGKCPTCGKCQCCDKPAQFVPYPIYPSAYAHYANALYWCGSWHFSQTFIGVAAPAANALPVTYTLNG